MSAARPDLDPPRSTIDRLAEALSEHDASAVPPNKGGIIAHASRKIGITEPYGRALFGRIRARLGDQAK